MDNNQNMEQPMNGGQMNSGMPQQNMNMGQPMPMNNGNVKSATTAGLLGIFLGAVGAHNWYLGEKNKGIIHCCLFGSGVLVSALASIILPNVLTYSALLTWGVILSILGVITWLIMVGNGIWGLVEGIIILSQGDAGLARKGYAVAAPAPQPYYGQQPMGQPMNGQNMPMNGSMPMGNAPMNNEPAQSEGKKGENQDGKQSEQ